MAKTAAETYVEQQIREAHNKPTWAELLKQIRERPGHRSYTGPSSAAIVREDRDSH